MHDANALDRLKDFCVLEQLAETAKKAVAACGIPGDQACYICLDDGGSEGLVRMCACRGNTGVAHLSCLVKQAQLATERTAPTRSRPIARTTTGLLNYGTRAASASRSTMVC